MEAEEIKQITDNVKAHVNEKLKIVEEVKTKLEAENKTLREEILSQKTENENQKAEIVRLGESIKAISEKGGKVAENFALKIAKEIQTRHEEIKAAFKEKKTFNFQSAAEPFTTADATAPDGLPALLAINAQEAKANFRESYIDRFINHFNTGTRNAPYTEYEPKDGNFENIGEGEVKPLSDFVLKARTAEPKKTAVKVILTEEAVYDIIGLQDLVLDSLAKRYLLKRQYNIEFGDGLGDNPQGMYDIATVFDASAAPFVNSVSKPNFMDVVMAMATKVATTHNYNDEMPYRINLILVNEIDYFINVLTAKTTDGVPLYPNAGIDEMQMGNLLIKTEANVPQGEILVADGNRYNVSNWQPYSVRMGVGVVSDGSGGYVSTDETNQFLLIAEGRYHAYVKNLDKKAFLKGVISEIKGNLQTAI